MWPRIAATFFCLIFALPAHASFFNTQIATSEHGEQWVWIEQKSESLEPSKPLAKILLQKDFKSFQTDKSYEFIGKIHSYFLDQQELYLVYPKGIYTLNTSSGNYQSFRSAPKDEIFCAMMKQDGQVITLNHHSENGYTLNNGFDEPISVASLNEKLTGDVHGKFCSGPGFIGLLAQPILSGPSFFYGIELHGKTPHTWTHDFKNEDFTNISLVGDEAWLFPTTGVQIKSWKKGLRLFQQHTFSHNNFSPDKLIAADKTSKGMAWLGYKNYRYQLSLPDASETIEIPLYEKEQGVFSSLLNNYLINFFLLLAIMLFFISQSKKQMRQLLATQTKAKPLKKHTIPANLFSRSMAYLFDCFIIRTPIIVVCLIVLGDEKTTLGMNYLSTLFSNPGLREECEPLFLTILFICPIVFIIYHVAMEYFFNASLGKMLFKIELMNDEGDAPEKKQIFIKGFSRIIDMILPVGLFVAAFSPKNKSIGDHIAKTMVGQATYYY